MYDYQQHYSRLAVEREKAVYEKLLGQYNQLLWAADEGVYEVTVRSQTGAVVVAVSLNDGLQIAHDLIELFCKRIDKAELDLNRTLAELGSETSSGLEKAEEEVAQREADIKRNQAAYNAQVQQSLADYNRLLAESAAASATPAQKGPGRPKKVQSQPELVGELASGAVGVPMNGSTSHAVARATNLPQG